MKKCLKLIGIIALVIPLTVVMAACGKTSNGASTNNVPLAGKYNFQSVKILDQMFVSTDFIDDEDIGSNGDAASDKIDALIEKLKTENFDEYIKIYEVHNSSIDADNLEGLIDQGIAEEVENAVRGELEDSIYGLIAGFFFFGGIDVEIKNVDNNYELEMGMGDEPAKIPLKFDTDTTLTAEFPDDFATLLGDDTTVIATWNPQDGTFIIDFKMMPTYPTVDLMMKIVLIRVSA